MAEKYIFESSSGEIIEVNGFGRDDGTKESDLIEIILEYRKNKDSEKSRVVYVPLKVFRNMKDDDSVELRFDKIE